MKEIRETQLNRITGSKTIMLFGSAKILSVMSFGKNDITIIYECEQGETTNHNRLKEFTFHITASFDFVPINSKYIGSTVDNNSLLHVYQER